MVDTGIFDPPPLAFIVLDGSNLLTSPKLQSSEVEGSREGSRAGLQLGGSAGATSGVQLGAQLGVQLGFNWASTNFNWALAACLPKSQSLGPLGVAALQW